MKIGQVNKLKNYFNFSEIPCISETNYLKQTNKQWKTGYSMTM